MSSVITPLWIFDISPGSNSKSRYKVGHEATDATQSVFRTRVRGVSLNKMKGAEGSRHLFEKRYRMSENACGPADNRKSSGRKRNKSGFE